jgi:hypothetical protein
MALACAPGPRVVERCHVHHVQQQAGALQMAQKLVPQPGAFGSPFDQARHSRQSQSFFGADAHHAQVGVQVVKG